MTRLCVLVAVFLSGVPLDHSGAFGQDLGFRTTGNDYIALDRVGDSVSGSVIEYRHDGQFVARAVQGSFEADTNLNLTFSSGPTEVSEQVELKYLPSGSGDDWYAAEVLDGAFAQKFGVLSGVSSSGPASDDLIAELASARRTGLSLLEYGAWLRAAENACAAKVALGLVSAANGNVESCPASAPSPVGIIATTAQVPLYLMVAEEIGESAPQLSSINNEQAFIKTSSAVLASIGEATNWQFVTAGFDTSSSSVVPRPKQRLPQFEILVEPETVFHRIRDLTAATDVLANDVRDTFGDVTSTAHKCMFSRGLSHPPTIVCVNHSSEFNMRLGFWILSYFLLDFDSNEIDSEPLNITATPLFETKYNSVNDPPIYSAFQPLNFLQAEESSSVDAVIDRFVTVVLDNYTTARVMRPDWR